MPIQPFQPHYPFTDEKLAQLKQIVPEAFEDGRLNFDTLKEVLEPNLDPEGTVSDDGERFGLLWPGKKEARRLAAIPSKGTLAPVYGQGLKADGTPDTDGTNDSRNVFIEGENLEVLKIMQKAYAGRVKMIYIDPPYNTGNDFVYDDNFTEPLEHYLRRTGQIDDEGQKLTTNTKADGRFHSKWLSMMYPRLRLARNLLREDGVIFISIDDNEVDNLIKLGKEVFGEYNYLGTAARVSKKANNQGDFWSPNFDFVLTFAKDRDTCESFFGGVNYSAYKHVETEGPYKGEKYQLVRLYMTSLDPLRGCTSQRYYIPGPNGINLIPPGDNYPEHISAGEMIVPKTKNDKVWRWSYDTYLKNKDKIVVKEGRSSNIVEDKGKKTKFNVFTKTYLSDVIKNSSAKPNSLIEDHINQKSSHELKELKIDFDFAKPSSLIKFLCEIVKAKEDDIVVDFFAGSGTVGHAVLDFNKENKQNCRFVAIQLPEKPNVKLNNDFDVNSISDISLERIRRKIRKDSIKAGFRTFSLYNNQLVEQKGESLQSLFDQQSTEKTYIPATLLWEVALNEGFPLDSRVETREVGGQTIQTLTSEFHEFALHCCFDPSIAPAAAPEITLGENDVLVCLDSALDDQTKLRLSDKGLLKTI